MPLLSRKACRSTTWVCHTCRNLSTAMGKQAQKRSAWQKIPKTPARTRFAPSPTGYLHLGSLRTALYNYLLARASGGQFILRVEDTDKKRTVAGAEDRLYADLKWAGLDWDEGPDKGGPHGPYRQSERTDLYKSHAQKLLQSGHAYRCFCSSERLNELATQRNQLGQSSDYDRTCAGISKEESDQRALDGEPHVIRLKSPAFPPRYFDLVYGAIGKLKSSKAPKKTGKPTYDDFILIKSDGLPTYHLANVVDDHHMEITHVIRASEWMTSTPKHLVMYEAFGWKPPRFAHVGLLQDEEHRKLSKRDVDLDLQTFMNNGMLPDALLNYVVLHGWSHNLGNDFMSLEELIKNFDLKFTKGNTIVQSTKLNYLQKKYAQKHISEGDSTFKSMVDGVYAVVEEKLQLKEHDQNLKNRIAEFIQIVPESYTTPMGFYERHVALFNPGERQPYLPKEEAANPDVLWDMTSIALLNQEILKQLRMEDFDWDVSEIRGRIIQDPTAATMTARIAKEFERETRTMSLEEYTQQYRRSGLHSHYATAVIQYLRWAVAGGKPGSRLSHCMVLLGRDETARRLEEAVRVLDSPQMDKLPKNEQ